LDLVADEKRSRVETITEQLDQRRNDNTRISNELDQVRSQLQTMRGRYASLDALQQAALGEKNKAVTQWLAAQNLTNQPRLAESVSVQEGWDKALETVLGNTLQAVCVKGLDAVTSVIGNLTQGELVLFDTSAKAAASDAKKTALLSSKVTADWDAAGLLNGIYIAEDLPAALQLRSQLAAHESVITKDGIWLGAHWLRVTRDSDASSGVIARKQEIEELSAKITDAEEKVETLSVQLEEGRQQIKEFEQNQRNLTS